MYNQKVKTKYYSMEEIIKENMSFHMEHRVMKKDVDKVNHHILKMSNERVGMTVSIGDKVRYTDKQGNYYGSAHIDSILEDGSLYICEQPHTPFVYISEDDNISFSTSGGAWTHIPSNLKCVGVEDKYFCFFGSCGATGNGAIDFKTKVLVWEYDINESAYSTKDYDKFTLFVSDKEVDAFNRYKYYVSKDASSHSAFAKEEELDDWIKERKGVRIGNVIWTYKQHIVYAVEPEDLNKIKGETIRYYTNARYRRAKKVVVGTSITIYICRYGEEEELAMKLNK